MTSTDDQSPTTGSIAAWIEAARNGDEAALGLALESFRGHLTLMASRAIGPTLATKVEASDMVQETFLAAQLGAPGFQGTTEAEWRAWLEAILINQLANVRRAYMDTRKRRFERPTPQRDFAGLSGVLQDENTPPSRCLQRQERDHAIEEALRLLPDHYRAVVVWHHDDGLTFEAIGTRMGISADAARKLWVRALLRLKQVLGPDHDPK